MSAAVPLLQMAPPGGDVGLVFAVATPLLGFIAWVVRDRIQGLKDDLAHERAERAKDREDFNKEIEVWQERAWNGTNLAEGGIGLARDSVQRRRER